MIPLRDANPSHHTPLATILLIAANLGAFLYELSLPPQGLEQFVFQFGVIPSRLTGFVAHPGIGFGDAYLPLLTSMFLHAGWLHLIGNMWFLWIFGDNIEDRLGKLRFLLFYLVCGLGAGLAHALFNLGSNAPTIGASGAVAGVLGGYFVLFPTARVLTLVPFFFLILAQLPAWLILLYWFVIQFFSGAMTLAAGQGEAGGVAWWAHVGGFLLGAVLVRLLVRGRRVRVVIP
jgi:hypothetical protein